MARCTWVLFILIGMMRPATSAPLAVERAFVGDAEGRPCEQFYPCDGAAFFYARLAGDGAGRHEVWLVVLDAAAQEVARLGGPFQGLDVGKIDFPRGCGVDNGFSLEGARPGRYRARLFVDGKLEREMPFTVTALTGTGRVATGSAHLEDATGRRRETYGPADGGVYARVSLVNLSRHEAHEHVFRVTWQGPRGPVGRALGGLLRVAEGARLDGLDFPAACDPDGHDGLRLEGLPPGRYTATIWLDGRIWARLPFQVNTR